MSTYALLLLMPCFALSAFQHDDEVASAPVLERIRTEASALADFVESDLAWTFLSETRRLPPAESRRVHYDPVAKRYLSRQEFEALPEATAGALITRDLGPETYYDTKYGTPVAYARAIDVLGSTGLEDLHGKKLLDYGYGTLGHLRLLALCGAHVVGVDVDSFLPALYCEPGDIGPVQTDEGPMGHVAMVDGRWPANAQAVADVGAGYDVFLSKNTLKRGYIHPAREVDERSLIDLGVDDETYLSHLARILNPGGLALLYNICPPEAGPDEAYIPWADGRSPFTRAQWEAAGFSVLAFDLDDTERVRQMGELLGWGDAGELEKYFAWYTLVRRLESSED